MSNKKPSPKNKKRAKSAVPEAAPSKSTSKNPPEKEIGGFKDAGLKEPTRYGDWEVKGRCSDF